MTIVIEMVLAKFQHYAYVSHAWLRAGLHQLGHHCQHISETTSTVYCNNAKGNRSASAVIHGRPLGVGLGNTNTRQTQN